MALALSLGVQGFQAGGLAAPVQQRAAVSMAGGKNFGKDPKDYPEKKVWTTVASSKDLKPSSLKACFGAGQDILIATDTGGKVFAAANVCPHIGTPLDQGTVENGAIVCPLHRSAFDLRTGKLVGPWCPAPPLIGPLTGKLKSARELQTFQARNQGGKVQVLLDVNAKKRFDASYWRGILDAQGKVDGGYY
jgi:nitrite reductase/ring-hydroxylating ferredoxin subunit